jgi:Transcription factor IIIC subunit delta N-term
MSTVVGLAWSPPGIGPHKRSVLAVLTSNHVLSLWESNGTVGEWKRVIVVNHSLGDYFGWVNEASQDINRARRRIRAFAWSPPFRCIEAEDGRVLRSKWGVVHLAVANDEEVVTILQLRNEERRDRLEWNMDAVCDVRLPTRMANGDSPHVGSLFQKAIMSKSPISKLSWSGLDEESSESFIEVTQCTQRQFIKVRTSLQPPEGGIFRHLERNLRLNAVYWENLEGDFRHDPQSRQASANAELNKKMEEARIEFDSHHTLEGNCIVRIWGFASHRVHEAACITLHPSDMVEYTTPSMGKCTLLFVRRDEVMDDAYPSTMTTASPTDVLFKVTSWILGAANQVLPILSMDRCLLGITASYAAQMDDEQMRQKAAMLLSRLRETSNSQLEHEDMAVDEPPPIDSLTAADIETCIICEALILFNEDDLDVAQCESGHQYSTFCCGFKSMILTNRR